MKTESNECRLHDKHVHRTVGCVSPQENRLVDEIGIIDQTGRMSRGGCCFYYIKV